jgi:hypothetical protein
MIEGLQQDEVRQIESFAGRWAFAAVRIIVVAGNHVGWLQTARTDDATDLGQLDSDREVLLLPRATRSPRSAIGRTALRMA